MFEIKRLTKISTVLLFVILLYWFNCYIGYGEEDQQREWKTIASGYVTFVSEKDLIIKRIEMVYMEEGENVFHINLQITIPKYNGTILPKPSNPDYTPEPILPVNPKEKNGTYLIEDLILKPEKIQGEYPYDKQVASITLEILNETACRSINFSEIDEVYSTDMWRIYIHGNSSKLEFVFSRIRERGVYETLWILGISTTLINFFAGLITFYRTHSAKKFLSKVVRRNLFDFLSDSLFYVGNIVGIPFYLGVIFNYVAYVAPSGARSNGILCILMVLAVSLGAICFYLRRKLKNQNP